MEEPTEELAAESYPMGHAVSAVEFHGTSFQVGAYWDCRLRRCALMYASENPRTDVVINKRGPVPSLLVRAFGVVPATCVSGIWWGRLQCPGQPALPRGRQQQQTRVSPPCCRTSRKKGTPAGSCPHAPTAEGTEAVPADQALPQQTATGQAAHPFPLGCIRGSTAATDSWSESKEAPVSHWRQ